MTGLGIPAPVRQVPGIGDHQVVVGQDFETRPHENVYPGAEPIANGRRRDGHESIQQRAQRFDDKTVESLKGRRAQDGFQDRTDRAFNRRTEAGNAEVIPRRSGPDE